jgi:transposase-like protein
MVAPEREPLRGEVECRRDPCRRPPRGSPRRTSARRQQDAGRGDRRGSRSGLGKAPPTRAVRRQPGHAHSLGQGERQTRRVVHTDGWHGYGKLAGVGFDHRPRRGRRDHPDAQKLLPRAHRASSNLKTWLQGTHRGVSPDHLQVYLDEFVFRHNRRRTPMAALQTLLGLGALQEPTTYREIVRRKEPPEPTG